MRNVHIVLLTKTVLNWIKFNSSKQNSNFSKYIPRERGGHPISCCTISPLQRYSPRTRGLPSVCRLDRKHICIFPANAGVFPASNPYLAIPFNIPRERGGQPTVACPGAGMRTFPCICRGQPASVLLHLTTGIFPANAGVTLLYIVSTDIRVLYSPRMRGSSSRLRRYFSQSSIFPANAGVNLRWRVRVQVCEHSPA